MAVSTQADLLISSIEETLEAYFQTHDVNYLTEDVVFRLMDSGQESHGRNAVNGLLSFFYQQAFDAHAEKRNLVVGQNSAVVEADFIGTHIGEFMGIPPTHRQVHLPFSVAYDFRDNLIKAARIYFFTSELIRQIS